MGIWSGLKSHINTHSEVHVLCIIIPLKGNSLTALAQVFTVFTVGLSCGNGIINNVKFK